MNNISEQFVKLQPTDPIKTFFNQTPFVISCPTNASLYFRQHAEWLDAQKVKYAAFIEYHYKVMEGRPAKKLWTVFQIMAKYIHTRNFRQCKLYHQRMIQNYKNIVNIIRFLAESVKDFEVLIEREREEIAKDLMQIKSNSSSSCQKIQQNQQSPQQNSIQQDKNLIGTGINYLTQYSALQFPNTMAFSHPESMKTNFLSGMQDFFSQNSCLQLMKQAPHEQPQQSNQELKQQWKQCHRLFLEWTHRLKNLIMPKIVYG